MHSLCRVPIGPVMAAVVQILMYSQAHESIIV